MTKTTRLLALALVFASAAVAEARSIRGTLWYAGQDPDCGHGQLPGPERLAGIRVGLCDTSGNALVYLGEQVISITDANGAYEFVDLAFRFPSVDVFVVKVLDEIPGMKLGSINCLNHLELLPCPTPTDEIHDVVCGVGDTSTASIEIDMSKAVNNCNTFVEGIDFVYCEDCTAKIGDLVWKDLDGDGVKDDDESGIPDVIIQLIDTLGNVVGTATTDENGLYLFDGICAGDYTVTVDPDSVPAGLLPCPCGLGDNRCSPVALTLANGQADLTVDFCYYEEEIPGGGEGCTPGYWKQCQHFDSWPEGLTPDTLFSDVFENAFPGKTLLEVLKLRGGGLNALGRHTVAALLNALSTGVDFDLSAGEVIQAFDDMFPGKKCRYERLKNVFARFNEQGCPLN